MFRPDCLERGLSPCSSLSSEPARPHGRGRTAVSLDLADTLPAFNELDLACRQDPELFFAESPADVELAKSLCQGCPLRTACLAGALERREPWGVWGGQLVLQGVVVPRKRPRGRPRKSEIAA